MDTEKKISILHLEDEALMIEWVRLRLEEAGIAAHVEPAANKTEFLHKYPSHSYDVILLDYQLPDFDGISALRMIRDRDPDTPVIMVSGALDEEAVITSLRVGATDYVLKNNMGRLVPCISRALEERERNIAHQQTLTDLQETKLRLSDIAANLPGGLYQFLRRIDGSYAIPWCSERFEKIIGVRAEQIKDNATPAFDQITDDDLANVIRSIEHSASCLQKWDECFRIKTAEGPPRWVHATSQPRRMQDGSIIWNGLILDITEQKRQEGELLQFRDHLQVLVDERTETVKQQAQIIDQIYDAVISMDLAGHITSWNTGAERIFGFDRNEMLGQALLVVSPEEEHEFLQQELQNVFHHQGALETELTLLRKNGERFNGYLSISLLRESTGEVIGMITYAMDISKIKQTESALQNSENRYRAVVETAVDGIITIDEHGIIETFNHAAEDIFGYRAGEVMGNNIAMLMPQSYATHHQEYVNAYLHHGMQHVIGVQREVSGLHKDGNIFPMQLSISEMHIDGRRKFTGMVRNITHIKQTKHALLASERLSRNILNSLTDHIAVLDSQGFIVQVNDAWEEFAQTNEANSRKAGIGCNYLTICQKATTYTEDFDDCAYQGIKAVLDKRRPLFSMEYPCHSHKQQHWYLMSAVPLLGEAGGAVVAHEDITERILTQQALEQSEQRLKEAQRIGRIGNWRWQAASGQIQWSEEIYRIFGRDPQDFHPSYEKYLSLVHPDDLDSVTDSEQRAFREGKPHSIDHRIILPDGSIRWVHEEAIAILDEYGNPISLTGTVQDITERKEIENQLVAAKNEAEQASRAKSEFLSSMSHELRTPLNAILGYTQLMLMDDMFTDDQLQSIDEINKAGEHLLHLISDLLDLAKIEAGHMQLNFENISLGEIIGECHQLVLPTAERRNIAIRCCNGKDCSNEQVRADRVRLKQVILNILSNAVKYNHDNGNINLKVEKTDGCLRLAITDTGKGISEHQMNKLFNAFNRLGAELTAIEGTGIGLVIAKNLIELMGGQIQLSSTPGQGTTFWIDIPVAKISGHSTDRLPGSQNMNDCTQCCDSANTILYIEDNPANVRLVKHVMKCRPNIHLLTATAGPQGLEIAARDKPDLVLLDITLPGMDGYEVLSKLQENEHTRQIPVIAVSANAMHRDIERGLNAGFTHYITKPIDVNKLLNVVDKSLDVKKGVA
ncbi:PAS domain S-box protein [Kaarinaea lacus]